MAGVLEYNLTGNAPGTGPAQHEDLSDLLAVVDAKSTPVTSMIPKGRAAGATTFHWQADAHVANVTTGTQDGVDVTTTITDGGLTDTTAGRKVLKNNVQIFRRAGRVSLLTDAVANSAGVRNELAHTVSRLILTQKRDIEKTVSSKNDARDGASGVAFQTKALQSWLNSGGQNKVVNEALSTGGADCPCRVPGGADGFRVPTGSVYMDGKATFTSDEAQDLLESIYEQTGVVRDYDLICDPQVKRQFTGFAETLEGSTAEKSAARIRTINKEQSDRAFVSTIDIFTGDFGTLRLHVSNFLEKRDIVTNSEAKDNTGGCGLILPMDMLELKYNMTTNVKPMTNNGGGEGRIITTIAGLAHKNPLSSGSINFTDGTD
jgi:hypothetical protein